MKKILFFLILMVPLCGFSQQKSTQKTYDEKGILNFLSFEDSQKSILSIDAKKLLKDSLRLSEDDDFFLLKEKNDNLGFNNQLYEQRYKGIKVEDGLYGVHHKGGKIAYIGGEYKRISNVIVVPKITEHDAFEKALAYIGANTYRWQVETENALINSNKKDSTVTVLPTGELVICRDVLLTNSAYRLAYRFDIFAVDPLSHKIYYIDALTGDLLDTRDQIFDTNANASGTSSYSNTVQFVTDTYNGGYRLFERRSTNNDTLHTYDCANQSTPQNNEITNSTTTWPLNIALDAHWGIEKVYDYWLAHGRRSLNGNGGAIKSYVHWNNSYENAKWDGAEILLGDGSGVHKPFVSLDVVAHECAHGITQFTCVLTPGFTESGALNEGFSDIWGAVVEHWAAPTDPNKITWLHGEQIINNGAICDRSLRSPKTEGWNGLTSNKHGGYPDTYNRTNWDASGEPHINSTVLSHWFYLLSQSGGGVNDLGNSYTVFPIGIDKAAAICWEAESNTLLAYHNANYSVASTQVIQAANNLYGSTSLEVRQVKNAWYAVGIGTAPTQFSTSRSGGTGGNNFACINDVLTFTVNNLTPDIDSIIWTKDNCFDYISGQYTATYQVRINSGGYGANCFVHARLVSHHGTSIVVAAGAQWVGPPSMTSISGPSTGRANTSYGYAAYANYSLGTSYTWFTSPTTTQIWPLSGTNLTDIMFNNNGYYMVFARASNTCGQYEPLGKQVYISGSLMVVAPNPASDVVNVEIKVQQFITTDTSSASVAPVIIENTTAAKPIVYSISVSDNMGIVQYTTTANSTKFELPIRNLRNGTYIITAEDGINKYTAQLIVKH